MDRVILMTFCAGPKVFPGFHLVPSLPTEIFKRRASKTRRTDGSRKERGGIGENVARRQ